MAGPYSDRERVQLNADAQRIAIYVMEKMSAGNGSGDVTGPAASTDEDIAIFDGTTGKKIKDSGVKIADLVKGPASAVDGDFAAFDGTSGELVKDSGYNSGSFVAASANHRRVLTGESRTVAAWTSNVVVGPFVVQDGGTITIEDEGILQVI